MKTPASCKTRGSRCGTRSSSPSVSSGLAQVWAIPIYAIGLVLLLLAYTVPILSYCYVRNQTVPDNDKVLTLYHFGEIANALMNKVGMHGVFNKGDTEATAKDHRFEFVGKSQGAAKGDPERVQRAQESRSFMAAKETGLRRRHPPRHRHPPRTDHRATLDPLPDRRHPPRGRTVRPAHRGRGPERVQSARGDGHLGKAEAARTARSAQSSNPAALTSVWRRPGRSRARRWSCVFSTTRRPLGKLEEVGLRNKMVSEVRSVVTQPHGMFLCCGPTGSGKTTTLYACLREIDRFQKNIITVEDPIEYHLDNITQMEINTKSGATFAGSLRSILRQDPDVIMIGEIRDQETATIACQAATTGHFVFSTVHSNDTITALFRLLDLGVEPFMIASALTAVLGQRLVRQLCDTCKEPYKPKPEFLKKANLPADKVDVFYRKPTEAEVVCQVCGGTATSVGPGSSSCWSSPRRCET